MLKDEEARRRLDNTAVKANSNWKIELKSKKES